MDRLLALYYDAKGAAADGRLGTEGRKHRVAEFEGRLSDLCRRSVITSVLESLRANLSQFTLGNVLHEVTRWMKEGISLFKQQLQAITAAKPALENTS